MYIFYLNEKNNKNFNILIHLTNSMVKMSSRVVIINYNFQIANDAL